MIPILIAVAVTLAAIAGVGTAAVWYFSAAPGESFRAPLPPLTESQKVLSARLKADVTMLATTIGPRDLYEHPKALEKAAQYVEAQFERAGYPPLRLRFKVGEAQVRNLEVTIPGTTNPNKVLVIGAHYDSVPTTPGADDNASGVAALLELARQLRARPATTTIRLVAFVNEEPPHFKTDDMGSLVYAKQLEARGEQVYGMVSLEMLGYYDAAEGSQKYPPLVSTFYPNTADFVAFVGDTGSRAWVHECIDAFRKHAQFPSEAIAAPSFVTGIDFSDHWSFRQTDVPALMVTDTSFFRYAHYHEDSDTADQLDYDRMARVVEGLIESLHAVADAAR